MYNKSATLILAALPIKNHLEPASVLVCRQSVKFERGCRQTKLFIPQFTKMCEKPRKFDTL